MKLSRPLIGPLAALIAFLTTACAQVLIARDGTPTPPGELITPPTARLDSSQPISSPQISPDINLTDDLSSIPTPIAPTPTPCPPDLCVEPGHFWLSRPIAPPGRDWVDPTYRYGSTQNGAREPHHGVEFVNSSGTPVLAAGDGEVVVAGDDSQALFAAWPNFYGNLVVIKHDFPGYPEPIYSLYAHLSEVSAQVGERVSQGQEIGRVGFTGVATGSHLHFEVRQGANTYDRTRNPELWLVPREDPSGQAYGLIAGRIEDGSGQALYVPNVVVEYLPGPDQEPLWQLYLETYADEIQAGDDQWGENFALGDLPAGWYRITFVARGLQVREVRVLPGMVTVVRVNVDG